MVHQKPQIALAFNFMHDQGGGTNSSNQKTIQHQSPHFPLHMLLSKNVVQISPGPLSHPPWSIYTYVCIYVCTRIPRLEITSRLRSAMTFTNQGSARVTETERNETKRNETHRSPRSGSHSFVYVLG